MSYHQFAMLYDTLMDDVPYEFWVNHITKTLRRYGNGKKRFLDLGCGTGAISIPLALQGYDITAIDLSDEMLTVAQEKAMKAQTNIDFYQQDMRELDGFQPFDCIGIFCDSLNYLRTEEDVMETFGRVFDQLTNGGIFLFDVHSVYKVEEMFVGHTYTRNADDISYIWNCYPGDNPHSVEHELTFFVQQQNHLYERFDEVHFQRTYSIEQYKEMLSEIGFVLVEITADFNNAPPGETSERIFFTAIKKEKE